MPWTNGDSYVTDAQSRSHYRTNWHYRLLPFLGHRKDVIEQLRLTDAPSYVSMRWKGVFRCPSFATEPTTHNYAMNGCIGVFKYQSSAFFAAPGMAAPQWRLSKVQNPSNIFLYADQNRSSNEYVTSSDGYTFTVYFTGTPVGWGNGPTLDNYQTPSAGWVFPGSAYASVNSFGYRHAKLKANAVFVDGHVEALDVNQTRFNTTVTPSLAPPPGAKQVYRWWSKAYPAGY